MSLRNLSFFSKDVSNNYSKQKSWTEYFTDTFNWLYERSPINFSSITGMFHPSIQRLMGNPFLGRALEVTNSPESLAKEIAELAKIAAKDPKGRAYLSFGPHPTVLLTRPDDIAQVFMHNSKNIDRGKLLDAFSKMFGDDNLFTIPSNKTWQEKRQNLSKWILQKDSLSDLAQPMQAIVDEFIDKIAKEGDQIASLETFMIALTMDVFARTRLASKPLNEKSEKISDEFVKGLALASEPMNTIWVRLDATLKYIGRCATKHLVIEKDELQKVLKENFFDDNYDNILKKPNILQHYVEQYVNNPEEAFKNTVSDIGLLLLAGHETTKRLIEFTLILLDKHPDILTSLREEIVNHRPSNGEWKYEDLEKLSYLEKILKETLRLYPPIPIIPRMVTETFVLADISICKTKEDYQKAMQMRDSTKDVILHAGTGIDIAPWVTHRLASLYEDPEKFNPDRYQNSSINSTDNYSWIPFGVGNRNCPGRKFALQEAKLFLLKFVEKYDFKASCEGANLLDTLICGTLQHKGKLKLDLTPRDNQSQRYTN